MTKSELLDVFRTITAELLKSSDDAKPEPAPSVEDELFDEGNETTGTKVQQRQTLRRPVMLFVEAVKKESPMQYFPSVAAMLCSFGIDGGSATASKKWMVRICRKLREKGVKVIGMERWMLDGTPVRVTAAEIEEGAR